jgi:hypothetical protein
MQFLLQIISFHTYHETLTNIFSHIHLREKTCLSSILTERKRKFIIKQNFV